MRIDDIAQQVRSRGGGGKGKDRAVKLLGGISVVAYLVRAVRTAEEVENTAAVGRNCKIPAVD